MVQVRRIQRVLLCESDELLAQVYMDRLQAEGHEVQRETSGEALVKASLLYKPTVIICNAHLASSVGGFDAIDALRSVAETAAVPVILLAPLIRKNGMGDDVNDLGFDEYAVKAQVVIGDVLERINQ